MHTLSLPQKRLLHSSRTLRRSMHSGYKVSINFEEAGWNYRGYTATAVACASTSWLRNAQRALQFLVDLYTAQQMWAHSGRKKVCIKISLLRLHLSKDVQ